MIFSARRARLEQDLAYLVEQERLLDSELVEVRDYIVGSEWSANPFPSSATHWQLFSGLVVTMPEGFDLSRNGILDLIGYLIALRIELRKFDNVVAMTDAAPSQADPHAAFFKMFPPTDETPDPGAKVPPSRGMTLADVNTKRRRRATVADQPVEAPAAKRKERIGAKVKRPTVRRRGAR